MPLRKNESMEEYIKRMDETKPYGVGFKGKACLFPQKNKFPSYYCAVRPDMPYQGDWSAFRKTGIGWKLNPTLYIAFFFFFLPILGYPLLYVLFGYPELFWEVFWKRFLLNIPFIIIVTFFTKLIEYIISTIDDLIKPYGKKKEPIQLLFIDELEYYKFTYKFSEKAYNGWWLIIGFLGFVSVLIFNIYSLFNINSYRETLLAPIPDWTIILEFIKYIGIGFVIFQLIMFFVAIIFGLFYIGNLGADPEVLSTHEYPLLSIINRVSEALKNKTKISAPEFSKTGISLEEYEKELELYGRTFYEFQIGNRIIGEFLFNISIMLIIFSIAFEIGSWLIYMFQLVQGVLSQWFFIFSILSFIFICLSIGIFILPQIYIHGLLKKFKNNLIDQFSIFASRLEYLYYESMINPHFLSIVGEWNSRKDLLKDIERIEKKIEKIKDYGTWSYDFPGKIRTVIFVGLSPIIPFILPFLEKLGII